MLGRRYLPQFRFLASEVKIKRFLESLDSHVTRAEEYITNKILYCRDRHRDVVMIYVIMSEITRLAVKLFYIKRL